MAALKAAYAGLMKLIRSNAAVNAVAQYVYLKAGLALKGRPADKDGLLFGGQSANNIPKVAFLCDEMTWQDFKGCCSPVFLHPKVWREQLDSFRPEVFFCESAWSGIEAYPAVWRGRIYRDKRITFENRDVLLEILAYCRENGIPTVFWNKEDPTYFNHAVQDFSDTALMFDCIFTTAQECVACYRERGHQHVYLLPFGVNTDMFYPAPEKQRKNAAVFAGSWFGDHPKRCQELAALLDYTLDRGWDLVIYDRNSSAPEERFRFPEKYAPYIRPAVPFTRMPEVCREYEYAINVNTVVDSSTMISRRVLQLAASGATIISNETMGFGALKDCLQLSEDNGVVIARAIPGEVEKHATYRRFQYVMDTVRGMK